MKYLVIICDGMSDEPLEELGGKTPLFTAKTSHTDTLARVSELGIVHTIPKGMDAESGIAILSVLGYNPSLIDQLIKDETGESSFDFYTNTGKKGAIVTADEKIKALAEKINLSVIEAEGATGDLSTNYGAKKDAAVRAFFDDDMDFVMIHVKASGVAGENKDLDKKISAIENIDAYIVGPLVEEMQGRDAEFRLLILPAFPTPVRLGSNSKEAVPYLLYDSSKEEDGNPVFSEKTALEKGFFYDEGYLLSDHFLEAD
ncbi:MAG: hypothetical protein J6X80_02265 [Lachnospiraceae bacterium]|nr:hypothetical protein [Lachnospiraceae bacterium]